MMKNVIYWVIEIPLVLAWAKWYFRSDPPSLKKGIRLGVIALLVGTLLDMIITIPLFLMGEANFGAAAADFYGDWALYVGFAILLLTSAYAGFEYDHTFTKAPKKNVENE